MAEDKKTGSISAIPSSDSPREAIIRALFETYESLYDIDVETGAYRCYHESESYSELNIGSSGDDFFKALIEQTETAIHPQDREYVRLMLDKDAMLSALQTDRYYSFVYRLLVNGEALYHKVRATMALVDGREHILIGVRDVDETLRQEKAHTEALASMYQKEKNHMEAIMASAAAYMEVNLTRDTVLEQSPYLPSGEKSSAPEPPTGEPMSTYSGLNEWICERQIVENRKKYALVSSRKYLLACFERGEKRASVSFGAAKENGGVQPCREVFYLYRDSASGDVMAFCVIYDLTEQQRKDKELRELEEALRMSRIRNFTSQMQPHFLYNALGSIQEVVLDDPEYACKLIGDFTVHLRSCIRAMANDVPVPFKNELDNIRAYVNIEKMRFGKKLNVVYDIAADDFKILPLSVQPLVENAIRHGIYQRGAKGGTVTVRSRETPGTWEIEVTDDGVGFDSDAMKRNVSAGLKDSTGLTNIVFRLDKVMHAGVDIKSVPGEGTRVVISVPKGGTENEGDNRR